MLESMQDEAELAVIHEIQIEDMGSSHRRVYRAVCTCGEYRSPGWQSVPQARAAGRKHLERVERRGR